MRTNHWSVASVMPRGGWSVFIKWGLLIYFGQALLGVVSGVVVGLKITGVL